MKVLNTELMANPMNWVIVTLMAVLASLAIRFLVTVSEVSAEQ